MEEQWPGQPVAANDSGAWPGQPEQQQEQPSTRGRLQPLINQLTPEEPERQTPEQIQQKGYEDFDFWNNTVRTFMAGTKGVEEAVKASEDPNRPWYERGMAQADVLYSEFTGAVSTLTGPAFQAVGGALEKLTGGYAGSSEEWQAALMLPGVFGGAKYAAIGEVPPTVKPSPIRPIEGSPNPDLPRSQAAQTGIPHVDAVLNSLITKSAIDSAVIDRSHDVPYMAGGSEPLDDPTVYIDKHVPKEQTAPKLSGPGTVTFDPAEPWAVHENVEQHTMELLIKGGMKDDEAYRVAHFEFAEKAEQAWYRAHDIDQEAAEKEQATWLPRIQHENPADPPPNLYEKPYPHGSVKGAEHESVEEAPPTPEEVAQAMKIIQDNTGPRITGGTADKPDLRVAKDLGVIGPERPSINEGTPEEAARNAIQPITAYHGSPYSFDAFDMGKIGTGEGATAYGHGLYFAENPAVAAEYVRTTGAQIGTPEHFAEVFMTAHGDDRAAAIADLKNVLDKGGEAPGGQRQAALDLLQKGWTPKTGQTYQVRIHADREHFLDWDKPLSEQSPHVQEALKSIVKDTNRTPAEWINSSPGAEQRMREAGIPGIKYLDEGSRFQPEQAEHLQKQIAGLEKELQKKPNDEAIKTALDGRKAELAGLQATRNYVVFDHNDVEITHRNGEPVKPVEPPTPPVKPEQPAVDSWRARFEHFVDRIQTADDIKQLIRNAADENQNFLAARRGDIPLAQVEKIAEASGMDTAEVIKSGIGRQLRNDDQVDLAMRIMLRTTDSAKEVAKQLMTDQSDQNFIKFQEALMRRDLAVEQIVGMRAEWGRTGNVFQKFMKEVKDGQALDKFISETCPL